MTYTPRFSYTAGMLIAMADIGAFQAIISTLPLPVAIERSLRRDAQVRVAHNSTWIENRTLALEEAAAAIADYSLKDPSRQRQQAAHEVRNYFQALRFIDHQADAVCDEDFICRLHALIMRGGNPGRPKERSEYRRDNLKVGNFVYVPPAWEDVPGLMQDLAMWASGPGLALPRPVFAAILAYQFVTIHPFHDGNGRTCRGLASWALRGPDDRHAVDALGLLNVEEFYAADLAGYYGALQMGLHFSYYDANERGSRSDPDLTPWIEFVMAMIARSARQVRESVVERFESSHASVLRDPVAAWPRTFRRLLLALIDPTQVFSLADVQEHLSVSDRTARTWLQEWHKVGLITPHRPGGQRVHAWVLVPPVIEVLLQERENQLDS
jgi:Fic family protein